MKKIALLLLCLASMHIHAQNFNRQKLDSLIHYLDKEHLAMGSLAIYQNGKKVYAKSFGYIDVLNRNAANPESMYRIGSISKTYTATIIMQLIEEGKFSLDTKLSDFYPDLPNASKITIKELLDHHSGLFNFTNKPNYLSWNTSAQTKDEMLAKFKANGTVFAPGEKGEYSNTNYVLLSFIAEDIEGRPFSQIFKKRIVDPLDLKHTRVGGKINIKNNEAKSYVFGEQGWEPSPETDMSVPMGAGAVVASAPDVAKFYSALLSGRLVADSSLAKMKTLHGQFGLGLMSPPYRDKTNFGHNGGIDGFQSDAAYFTHEKTGFALCTNGIKMSLNNLMLGIFNIYFGYDYDFPSFAPVENAEQYVGEYSSSMFPLDITIFTKDHLLYAQGTGQPPFRLNQTGENTFEYKAAGVTIEFIPEKQELKLSQHGMRFLFKRKE